MSLRPLKQPTPVGGGPAGGGRGPEAVLQEYRSLDASHLYDELRVGALQLPAPKRALMEQPAQVDEEEAERGGTAASRLGTGTAPRAFAELSFPQELRMKEMNEAGLRFLASQRARSAERMFRTPPAAGVERTAGGVPTDVGEWAVELEHGEDAAGPAAGLLMSPASVPTNPPPSAVTSGGTSGQPRSLAGTRPVSSGTEGVSHAQHALTSVGLAAAGGGYDTSIALHDDAAPVGTDGQSPGWLGAAGGVPESRYAGLAQATARPGTQLGYLSMVGAGPGRPVSKGLVAGHAVHGSLLALSSYRPSVPPLPPVRPESLGGIGFLALRPAPPLLWWRLYQRAALNPSPAFTVQFFRRSVPSLLTDGRTVPAVNDLGEVVGMASVHEPSYIDSQPSHVSTTRQSTMEDSLLLDIPSVQTVQPSADNGFLVEVHSSPTTGEEMKRGAVRVQSGSSLVTRMGLLRSVLAGATSFAAYLQDVERQLSRRNAQARSAAVAATAGAKDPTGKAAAAAALAQLCWGDGTVEELMDDDGGVGSLPGGGIDSGHASSVMDLSGDPAWDDTKRGTGWEPYHLAQASTAQFLGDGEASGEVGGSGVAPTPTLRPEEGGEGWCGLRDHSERNPAFWESFNLYWDTAPWSTYSAAQDVEALGRAGGSGVDKPGVRLCGCGCGRPWGAHMPFPAYVGGGWLQGHEATQWDNTSAFFLKRAMVMHTREVLVPDARNVAPLGVVANAVLDFSAGWMFDSAALATLGSTAKLARVLRLSPWHGPSVTPTLLLNALLAMPNVQHLHAPGADAWADASLCATVAAYPCIRNLRSLDVSLSAITDAGLLALVRAAPGLRSLFISGCVNVTSAAVLEIGKKLRHLHTLDLSWCTRIDGYGVAALLAECGGMERLSLRGLGRGYALDVVGVQVSMPAPGKGDGEGASDELGDLMEDLMEGDGVSDDPEEPAGVGLQGRPFLLHRLLGARVELLVHLVEVDLEATVGVSDATVISLVRNSEGALQRVRLGHCTALTAASTTAVAMFCPYLTHLSVHGCTGLLSPIVDATIAATLAVQAGLDREAGLIPDRTGDRGTGWGIVARLRALDEAGPRRSTAPAWPGGTAFDDTGRPDVRQGGLRDVPAAQWTHLQLIDFSGCSGVESYDVEAFIEGCPELRDVRLNGVHNVSDETFGFIVGSGGRFLGALKSLRLGFQPGVTDETLRVLSETCIDLRVLELEACTSVSDEGLQLITNRCVHLREVRANGCSDAISMGGILRLAQACRQLRVLEFGRALVPGAPFATPPPAFEPTRSTATYTEASRRAAEYAAAAARVEASLPPGSDNTFPGTLLEYVLSLGVCCPYLEQLDLTGRRPATRGKAINTGMGAMHARAAQLMAMSQGAPQDPTPSAPTAAAGPGETYMPPSTVAEDELLKLDGAEAEIVLPQLQRLVLRLAGPLNPRQLRALIATSPSLLSADLTDVRGLTPEDVRVAISMHSDKAPCAPYVHLVAQGVPGSEAELLRVREAEEAAGLPRFKAPVFPASRSSSPGPGSRSSSPGRASPGRGSPSLLSGIDASTSHMTSASKMTSGTRQSRGQGPAGATASRAGTVQQDKRRSKSQSVAPPPPPPPPASLYPLKGLQKTAPLLPTVPFGGWSRTAPVGTPAVPASRLVEAATKVRHARVGALDSALFPADLRDKLAGGSAGAASPPPPRSPTAATLVWGARVPPSLPVAPPTLPQQLTPAGQAALQWAATDTLRLTNSLMLRTVPVEIAGELQPNQIPPSLPRAMGFDPVPGACFARAAALVAKRLATERIAANRIRVLIRHGLRIQKVWFWTLQWRVRIHALAKLQFAARRIQRVWKVYAKWLAERRLWAACTIQTFWRRLLFIDRVRKRVLAVLQARRAAMTKQLAAALMAHTVNRALQRQAFDVFRLNCLIERWKDERRINRLRGLGPVYGHDGKLKVQFALPLDGPEILGAKDVALEEANAMEVIIRANIAMPLLDLTRVTAKGPARPASGRTVQELVSAALGREGFIAAPSSSLSQTRSMMNPELEDSQAQEHGGNDGSAGWEYGYAYKFTGLKLADPRRVRRRKSWVKRRSVWTQQDEARRAAAAAEAAALAEVDETRRTGEDGAMRRFGLTTLEQKKADDLARNRAKRFPRPGTADGRPLPTRPHRPRRNSFDLVGLSKADPDEADYDEGWESYDSADEPENREFLTSQGEVVGLAGKGEFDRPPSQAARAKGLLPAPRMIGAVETRLLLDGAAEDSELDVEALEAAEAALASVRPAASDVQEQPPPLRERESIYAAFPPASQQGGRRPIDMQAMAASMPAYRPESVYARRVAHARDHALAKLARLHVAVRQTKNAITQARQQLESETFDEQNLRLSRDAYERSHGDGSSKHVAGWAELDARNRVKVQTMFANENRVTALQEEIRICTDALKAAEKKMLAARRQREIRQISVATARAADPAMLVKDPATQKFRLADDASARLTALYGSAPSLPVDHPAYGLSAYPSDGEQEEKKSVDNDYLPDGSTGVVVALPRLLSGEESKAVDSRGAYGTDVSLSVVGFRKSARSSENGPAQMLAKAAKDGMIELDGRMVDIRDAHAVAVMNGDLQAEPGTVLGLRPAAGRALAAHTTRPQSGSGGKLLPIKHSPYIIKPGRVKVVLPNPDGIGGQPTADYGTGQIKRTTLSKVLRMLGVATEASGGFAEEAALGGLIAPLAMAARPLEGMVAILGPLAFIQAAKKRMPVELREYIAERKVLADKRKEITLGVQRRLRHGLARRVQYAFRSYLAHRLLREEMRKIETMDHSATLDADRKSGRAEPPNCATAPRDMVRAAVVMQAGYRRFSAKLFRLRARRALAVVRARELLSQLGAAISASGMAGSPHTDVHSPVSRSRPAAGDAAELGRAYVLAGQVRQQLQAEQSATHRMRRASVAFDRRMAAQQSELDEAGLLLGKLGEAIASGAELNLTPDPGQEFAQYQQQFESGRGFGVDSYAERVNPRSGGAVSSSSRTKVDPLLEAYRELSRMMAMELGVTEKRGAKPVAQGPRQPRQGPGGGQARLEDGSASGRDSSPEPRVVSGSNAAGQGAGGGRKPRRASYYATFDAEGASTGFQGATGWVLHGSGIDEQPDQIREDEGKDDASDGEGAGGSTGSDEGEGGGRQEDKFDDGAEAHRAPSRLHLPADGSAGTGLSPDSSGASDRPRPPVPIQKSDNTRSILKKDASQGHLSVMDKGEQKPPAKGGPTPVTSPSTGGASGGGGFMSRMFSGGATPSGGAQTLSTGKSGRKRGDSGSEGGGSRRSGKSARSKDSRDLRAKSKAADDLQRRAKYYAGLMPAKELIAYRSHLDDEAFMSRLDAMHGKAEGMEAWFRSWLLESLPLVSDDMMFRFGMLAADRRDWSRHWNKVAEYMASQAAALPGLTDPLIILRRARLTYRLALLHAVLDVNRTQAADYAGVVSSFKLMAGWGERVAYNLVSRARKDVAVVKRIKRQLPAAHKVLLYIERRLHQLNSAMDAWKSSAAHKKSRAWKAADIMRDVVAERDVEAFAGAFGLDGDGSATGDDTDGERDSPVMMRRRGGASEADGEEGMSRGDDSAYEDDAPSRGGTPSTAKPSRGGASGGAYDWRSTDEWVVRQEASGPAGMTSDVYVHMPTGFKSKAPPKGPPPGYTAPEQVLPDRFDNPAKLPTQVGTDVPAPPPLMSPTFVPSAMKAGPAGPSGPGSVPTSIVNGAVSVTGLPAPLKLDQSAVRSTLDPVTGKVVPGGKAAAQGMGDPAKSPKAEAPGSDKTKAAGGTSDVKSVAQTVTTKSQLPSGVTDKDSGKEAATSGATDGDEATDIAATIARSRAIAKKGGFDVEDARSEMWWLKHEAALVKDAIFRMESFLKSVHEQHYARAEKELQDAESLRSSIEELATTREEERRVRTELVQVQQEVASQRYHASNAETLERLAKLSAVSFPRFGRLQALPPHPRELRRAAGPSHIHHFDAASTGAKSESVEDIIARRLNRRKAQKKRQVEREARRKERDEAARKTMSLGAKARQEQANGRGRTREREKSAMELAHERNKGWTKASTAVKDVDLADEHLVQTKRQKKIRRWSEVARRESHREDLRLFAGKREAELAALRSEVQRYTAEQGEMGDEKKVKKMMKQIAMLAEQKEKDEEEERAKAAKKASRGFFSWGAGAAASPAKSVPAAPGAGRSASVPPALRKEGSAKAGMGSSRRVMFDVQEATGESAPPPETVMDEKAQHGASDGDVSSAADTKKAPRRIRREGSRKSLRSEEEEEAGDGPGAAGLGGIVDRELMDQGGGGRWLTAASVDSETPAAKQARKALKDARKTAEASMRKEQSIRSKERFAEVNTSHVDNVQAVASAPLPGASVRAIGSTQFVKGGAMINGYTYGVVRGGRFGRHVTKPSDLAKAEAARKMSERALQTAILEKQSGLQAATRLVADKTSTLASVLAQVSAPTEEEDEDGIDLSEWKIPARRPPVVRATSENLAYYSIAGDGEELGNPGFYYWGRDSGTVEGLFGIKIRVPPVGGYLPGEESDSPGSDSDSDDVGRPTITALEHGRQVANLRAQSLRARRLARRARRVEALKNRMEGKEGPLKVGLTREEAKEREAEAAAAGMGESAYAALVGEDAEALRRRRLFLDDAAVGSKLGIGDEGGDAGGLAFETRDANEWLKAKADLEDKSRQVMRAAHAIRSGSLEEDTQFAADGEGGADIRQGEDSVGRTLAAVDKSGDAAMTRLLEAAYEEAMLAEDEVDELTGEVKSAAARSLGIKKDTYKRLLSKEAQIKTGEPDLVTVAGPWAKLAQAAGYDHVISVEQAEERAAAKLAAHQEAERKLAEDNEARTKAKAELDAAEGDDEDSFDGDWGDADFDSDVELLTESSDEEAVIRAKRKAKEGKVRQVVADAADTPRWWIAVGLDDEEALMAARGKAEDAAYVRLYRGFGGGVLCSRSEDEYASRLASQEYKTRSRLSEVVAKRDLTQNRIDDLLARLEKASQSWTPYKMPPLIQALIDESIVATDLPARQDWEEEQLEKAKERKAAKDVVERDKKKRAGMTDADMRKEEEEKKEDAAALLEEKMGEIRAKLADDMGLEVGNPAHKEGIDAAVELYKKELEAKRVAAELDEFKVVRAGEGFRSGGFQGIVAPDGSILEWAGDGAAFQVEQWKARYRVKPWVVDSAILRFMASKEGAGIMNEEDMAAALLSEGAQAMIRAYKMGEEDLPLSGFEAARVALQSKKGKAAVDAARKAAEQSKAEADRLRNVIAERQAKAARAAPKRTDSRKKKDDQDKTRKDAAKKRAAADAADQAKDQMQRATRAIRNLMLNVQKGLAEYRLKSNKNLQTTVASVRKHATAALGVIEGIADVHFTFGVFADSDWATAQREAFGMADPALHPYFMKLGYNLGSIPEEPVYLWFNKSNEITRMITHLVWAPTPNDDPTAQLLRSKGYLYITHPALFPGFGLWFQRGSGKPISAITATFDSAQKRLMEQKGFKAVEGLSKSEYIGANVQLWYRSGRQKKRAAKAVSEVVRDTENAAMEAKIAYMESKINASKEAKKGKGGAENQTLQEGLARAKADYAGKKKEAESLREDNMQKAAIDFLGLKDGDVGNLRTAFSRMDNSNNQDGDVDLSEFFKFCDVERTPLADSIFFFLDGQFSGEVLSFGTFLRTVCSFCMFGAKEVVNWTFSVVAANVVAKAEALHDPPKPGRCGARGMDRKRNRSVFWDDAVAWSAIQARDATAGKMSVQAFALLLYAIHPPTSALALTVKRSIARAKEMSVGGDLRLFQFRTLATDFPTLLSPIFLLQTRMRQKFLGESWWATKRQLFSDARDIVKEQLSIETRLALLKREADRAQKTEEKKRALEDKKESEKMRS